MSSAFEPPPTLVGRSHVDRLDPVDAGATLEPDRRDGASRRRTGGDPSSERRRRFLVAGLLLGAALLALVGFMSIRSDREPDRIVLEGPAPAFDLPQLGDAAVSVSLAAHRGTPVVVNFWASWCVPCRKEMPALAAASERVDGKVAFIGVNHQDREADALEFEQRVGVQYPSGFDPDGDVAAAYGLRGLPSTILVDERGNIVARLLGEVTEAELEGLLRRAFGVGSQPG